MWVDAVTYPLRFVMLLWMWCVRSIELYTHLTNRRPVHKVSRVHCVQVYRTLSRVRSSGLVERVSESLVRNPPHAASMFTMCITDVWGRIGTRSSCSTSTYKHTRTYVCVMCARMWAKRILVRKSEVKQSNLCVVKRAARLDNANKMWDDTRTSSTASALYFCMRLENVYGIP